MHTYIHTGIHIYIHIHIFYETNNSLHNKCLWIWFLSVQVLMLSVIFQVLMLSVMFQVLMSKNHEKSAIFMKTFFHKYW